MNMLIVLIFSSLYSIIKLSSKYYILNLNVDPVGSYHTHYTIRIQIFNTRLLRIKSTFSTNFIEGHLIDYIFLNLWTG